jgi:hypothetical protein
MAETLGSLCDKLTIVKLKQWHSEDEERLRNLCQQANQLCEEIDGFLKASITGDLPINRLIFDANKVYKKEGNAVAEVIGSIGQVFAQLAHINCELWHEQEKVYEFEKVPLEDKDNVVKQLAKLNLQRNQCIDCIDRQFHSIIKQIPRIDQT